MALGGRLGRPCDGGALASGVQHVVAEVREADGRREKVLDGFVDDKEVCLRSLECGCGRYSSIYSGCKNNLQKSAAIGNTKDEVAFCKDFMEDSIAEHDALCREALGNAITAEEEAIAAAGTEAPAEGAALPNSSHSKEGGRQAQGTGGLARIASFCPAQCRVSSHRPAAGGAAPAAGGRAALGGPGAC
eukprot:CAMPEP_0176251012 /NCGR_PEP_ID=MMETSP0121_2-20121125/34780_1 /TAXON_ID=160619 /ORGANISM="Kryptoperidinium foliaceum, Strain CCMP 1326" /LENGTH=188 /DNA_ID=CAMNT_0017590743 /DNA_START=121 /DNA_END=686 /DNA_ORIENTATION=+